MIMRRLLFSCLLCGIVGLALCAAIPPQQPPSPSHLDSEPHSKRSDACGFAGNSDLYGLGIRLGVYFQWASALIIYGWYPEGRIGLAESYLVFLFATTIAVIVITARQEPTYAAEVLILTYIIFGGLVTVVSVGVRQRHHNRFNREEGYAFHVLVISIIWISISIYCLVFWLFGFLDYFLRTPCGTFGFLFTKVSIYSSPIQKCFGALSIVSACFFPLLWPLMRNFPAAAANVTEATSSERLERQPMATVPFNVNTNIETESAQRTSQIQLYNEPSRERKTEPCPLKRNCLRAILESTSRLLVGAGPSSISLSYSIIGIGMTIYWNSISGVYTINSTGQLIPFVIGLFGLIKFIYKSIKLSNHKNQTPSVSHGDKEHLQKHEAVHEEADAHRRLAYLDLSTPVKLPTARNLPAAQELMWRGPRSQPHP